MLTLKPNTKLKKKMKRPYHNKAVTCLTLVAMLLFTGTAIGAGSFDHRYVAWNKLLTTHTENGFVNYQELKKSPEDFGSPHHARPDHRPVAERWSTYK